MGINFRKETREDRRSRLDYQRELSSPLTIDGVTLRSYQRELFESNSRIRVAHWGRRTGKTTAALAIAKHEILNGKSVGFAVHNDSARNYITSQLGILGRDPNLILCVPKAHSIRGISRDIVILDEFEFFTKRQMNYVESEVFASPSTKLVALSTKSTNNNLNDIVNFDYCFYSSVPTTHPEVGINTTDILANVPQDLIEMQYTGY